MKVKFSRCNSSDLASIPVVDGQLIYIQDKDQQYLDVGQSRTRITDIVFVDDESKLSEIETPSVDKLYFVKNSSKLKGYSGSDFIDINVTNGKDIAFSDSEMSSNNIESAIIELKNKLKTTDSNVEENATSISSMQQNITDIQSNMAQSSAVEALETDIEQLKQKDKQLEEKAASAENSINTINESITSLEETTEQHTTQISDLETQNQQSSKAIETLQTDISNLKETKIPELETNISTNTSNIESNSQKIETNASSIKEVKTALNEKVDKSTFSEAGNKVVSDISVSRTTGTDNVSIVEKKLDIESGLVTQETNEIPLATATEGGLMPKESFKQIKTNTQRIERLEQQGGKYIGVSFKTYAELIAYEIPETTPDDDFTFVEKDENYDPEKQPTTRYIVGTSEEGKKQFNFGYVINYEPVGDFTEEKAGLITGSTETGKVFAESDGTGSVVGFDKLQNGLEDVKTDLEGVKPEVLSLQTDLSQTQTDLSSLQTKESQYETKVDGKLETLETNLQSTTETSNAAKTKSETNEKSISQLQTKVDAQEVEISNLTESEKKLVSDVTYENSKVTVTKKDQTTSEFTLEDARIVFSESETPEDLEKVKALLSDINKVLYVIRKDDSTLKYLLTSSDFKDGEHNLYSDVVSESSQSSETGEVTHTYSKYKLSYNVEAESVSSLSITNETNSSVVLETTEQEGATSYYKAQKDYQPISLGYLNTVLSTFKPSSGGTGNMVVGSKETLTEDLEKVFQTVSTSGSCLYCCLVDEAYYMFVFNEDDTQTEEQKTKTAQGDITSTVSADNTITIKETSATLTYSDSESNISTTTSEYISTLTTASLEVSEETYYKATKSYQPVTKGYLDETIKAIPVADDSQNGLMSSAMMSKLDKLNNYDDSTIKQQIKTVETTVSSNSESISSLQQNLSTLETSVNNKVDKVTGKGLSTRDFTAEYEAKLESLNNYDDKEIKSSVEKAQTTADTAESNAQAALTGLEDKVDKVDGKTLTSVDFTKEYETKLRNIQDNANKYDLPIASSETLGGIKVGEGLSVDEEGVLTNTVKPEPDTKVTNTQNDEVKAYITGTTNAETNTGTQVFDTNVFIGENPGELNATTFKGDLQGNAETASKLKTGSTINNVKFDGSENITIKDDTKLPLTGGTLTGPLAFGNSANSIEWTQGTYKQRIQVTDDNQAGTNVYEFQQEGVSDEYTTLMSIKDNGEVVANKFTGTFNGNATSATKATSDGSNQNISETYIKDISAKGKTITVTKGNGTTSTFDTQDTNTTYTAATSQKDGLMTASMVTKLDGIEDNATANEATSTVPKANSGDGVVGIEETYARGDHQHPVQTTISGNAGTASKLKTQRTIKLSGAVTGETTFDGSVDREIVTTLSNIDASKITTGTLPLTVIPPAALPTMKVVLDDAARFKLTTKEVQNGDIVKVTSTKKMFMIKDETNLDSEDGYESFVADIAASAEVCTGNSATASKLLAPAKINGTDFDGSKEITTNKWGAQRKIKVSDNKGINIGPESAVDGSTDIQLKLPQTLDASITGNAGTATKLSKKVQINGVDFDGSIGINVSDNSKLPLTGGTLTLSSYSGLKLKRSDDTGSGILFENTVDGEETPIGKIGFTTDKSFAVSTGSAEDEISDLLKISSNADATLYGNVIPSVTNTKTLGTSSNKWSNIFATKVNNYTLNAASAKAVDTTIANQSTSENLPTSKAVASFVEGKGYKTTDNNFYPTTFTWTNGTTAGPTGSLTGSGMDAVSIGAIPSANGTTTSGIITTGAQTIGGQKTFASSPKLTTNSLTTSGGYAISIPNTKATTMVGTDLTQNLTNKKYEGLTLASTTNGFTISGGTTAHTLTVNSDITLASAASKGVVTTIDTSANLPTSGAVKTFVEGKGYKTTDTWIKMVGATSTTDGTAGYVPAPEKTNYNKAYLRADGTWSIPPDTDTKYTSLKNPNPIVIQGNGTNSITYDGSSTKTLNIKPGANVSVASDTDGNITIGATNTNTHFTTHLYAGAVDGSANAETTNGNTYLILLDDSNVRDRRLIKGTGATKVTSDSSGNIIINSTDTNTTYTAGTGISISSTTINNSGVRSVKQSSTKGKISVDTGGTTADVAVYGLADLAYIAKGTSGFLRYDGTWVAPPNDNTIPSAYCSTAAGTAAKTASCSGYNLSSKSYIQVIVTTTNTVQSALTLNINGKGAKAIYINGSASSASNYSLTAGSYLVYYDGTNYYFRTDGKITGNITGDAATVNGKTVQTAVPSNAVFTDTKYTGSNGISLSGTVFSNSGVRSVATGTSNGTINVDTGGTTTSVAVKGLGTAAYKNVDTSMTTSSTSANVPTTAAVASAIKSAVSTTGGCTTQATSLTCTLPDLT